MKKIIFFMVVFLLAANMGYSQSPSFQTYLNPVIPGDHPDPTLTKIGDDYYTSGSSFNPTPKIYHSTDLVHWEVIAQPVSASWSNYGDEPGGGIWGGHMVLYNDTYWHFFGRGGGSMYFVKADQPEGPWSNPTRMQVPGGIPGLGVDNSIFIDEKNDTWYLLAKNGRENNYIVELGDDGQPTGKVLDLTWLNPDSEGNPYGWAEGPVMWKHDGYYYYSFAQHLAGAQYVMRSDTLSDAKSDWTIVDHTIFTGTRGTYNTPNHIAPVVMTGDGTSWTFAQSYNSDGWYAQGRQGLLCQVTYNDSGFPEIQYPSDDAVAAPALPGSGIPWMVPKSDMFNSTSLDPEWSFLGQTSTDTWSLTERRGWLHLEPKNMENTVIKNDGEHQYSLVTRLDFEADPTSRLRPEAGLQIINGPQTLAARVSSTLNDSDEPVFKFSFGDTSYETPNTIGAIAWLKLVRDGHTVSGYYSSDGGNWTQIGASIDATAIDQEQTQFNDFTGNQQGLYVRGQAADFDLYIYRDAYSSISALYPANKNGVNKINNRGDVYLGGIQNGDWAMYAGVEFGKEVQPAAGFDYQRTPDSLNITASSSSPGTVEVWLDSMDTGRKIAEQPIESTGGRDTYKKFSAPVDSISGRHDVYLRFTGNGDGEFMRLKQFSFTAKRIPTAIPESGRTAIPQDYSLYQNYPNPFNPSTKIKFRLQERVPATLKVFNVVGREVATLLDETASAGLHEVTFDGSRLSSGIYFYRLETADFSDSKAMILTK